MEVKALQQLLSQFRTFQENLQKQVETMHVDSPLPDNAGRVVSASRIEQTKHSERPSRCCKCLHARGIGAVPQNLAPEELNISLLTITA